MSEVQSWKLKKHLPEPCQRFVALVRRGDTLKQAAAGIGENLVTIARWRKAYPIFDRAIKEAETAYASKAAKTKPDADIVGIHVVRSRVTTSPDGLVTEELEATATDMKKALEIIKRPTRPYLGRIFGER